jgi:hypothetical protein
LAMVSRTFAAAAAATVAGAVLNRLLSPIFDAGVGDDLLLLSAVGLVVGAVFLAVLHLLRAPERRLLAEAVEVVTLRRR